MTPTHSDRERFMMSPPISHMAASPHMRRPLVSIGMPVYNHEQCIGTAIESVLAQTYANFEVVICDNCSTDRTEEICRKYAARNDRIRYSRNPTNIGKTKNFLRVLELATGDFFMWACADDIRPTDSLENLMNVMLRSPQAVMAHGPAMVDAAESRKMFLNSMNLMHEDPGDRMRAFVRGLDHNVILYSLYKAAVLRRLFPRTDFLTMYFGHDYRLCLQMSLLGPVEYSAKPMIIYKESALHPNPDPMGAGKPVTLLNILTAGPTVFKAWATLLYGCYYLLRSPGVSVSNRLSAARIFGTAFLGRYRGRLLRDAVLILTVPLRWLVSWTWPLARRSSTLVTFGRKIKTREIGLQR
jgi:hypothetical protein